MLGIGGASLTSFVNGTTEDGPTVYQNDANLKTWGINNDGVIQTNGSGSLSGLIAVSAQTFNPTTPAVVVNGQTSGTATCYQIMQGTFKKFIIVFSNYKNTGNQYLTLPTAFSGPAWFNIGDTGGGHLAFYTGGSGGSSVTLQQITSFGSANPQSFTLNYSIGMITAGFDTVQFQANSSAANGLILAEGI